MFQGKVVLITGSAQGIGAKTAELFAQKGAKVVINDIVPEKVDDKVNEMENLGYEVMGVVANVANYGSCLHMRLEIIRKWGRIDVLINNAGISSQGYMEDSSPVVYEQSFRINTLGSLFPTMVMLDELKKTKGSILFISSLAGILGLPGFSAYSGTKRAIVGIAESLKNELVDYGIFVGVNYPGFTQNDKDKKIVGPSGKASTLAARTNVKVIPVEVTASRIIRQIEKRKFRSFSSMKGYWIYTTYRLFPALSLWILKINRQKIKKNF